MVYRYRILCIRLFFILCSTVYNTKGNCKLATHTCAHKHNVAKYVAQRFIKRKIKSGNKLRNTSFYKINLCFIEIEEMKNDFLLNSFLSINLRSLRFVSYMFINKYIYFFFLPIIIYFFIIKF